MALVITKARQQPRVEVAVTTREATRTERGPERRSLGREGGRGGREGGKRVSDDLPQARTCANRLYTLLPSLPPFFPPYLYTCPPSTASKVVGKPRVTSTKPKLSSKPVVTNVVCGREFILREEGREGGRESLLSFMP